MSAPRPRLTRPPKPANDNDSPQNRLGVEVLIPNDLPMSQVEIEVFAALLEDWDVPPANDNEEPKG